MSPFLGYSDAVKSLDVSFGVCLRRSGSKAVVSELFGCSILGSWYLSTLNRNPNPPGTYYIGPS